MNRFIILVCLGIFTLIFYIEIYSVPNLKWTITEIDDIIDFTEASNITGFPRPIVPNIFHMVHFGPPELNFSQMLTIKTIHANHNPDQILIHCNCTTMSGKYWNFVSDIPGLEIRFKEQPKHIFGRKISWIQHAADVARLEVLMEYGGIYLDSDVYVVSSLDKYRFFEFVIGWEAGEMIGNQVIIAHKDARFLKLYYDTYRQYNPTIWYYNAGELPTKSILHKKPYLVHRVMRDFGVDTGIVRMLYKYKTDEWKSYKTIHLFIRNRGFLWREDHIMEFNDSMIKTYDRTFGEMARLILYGSKEIFSNAEEKVFNLK